MKGSRRWTSEETKFLLENYSKLSIRDIAKHLGRSYSSVALEAYWLRGKGALEAPQIKRKKHLTDEERLVVYKKAMELHKQGFGPRSIIKILPNAKGSIIGWLYLERVPGRRARLEPNLSPSPSLSYILGVLLGDGYVTQRNKTRTIFLTAKDEPFCVAFYEALKEIGLNPNLWQLRTKMYRVAACSVAFLDWYRELALQDIGKLVIDYSEDFVRGFYDSEGSLIIWKGKPDIRIFNTNVGILKLVKKTLINLGFETSLLISRKQELKRKTLFSLRILDGKESIKGFCQLIKPSIPRKIYPNPAV